MSRRGAAPGAPRARAAFRVARSFSPGWRHPPGTKNRTRHPRPHYPLDRQNACTRKHLRSNAGCRATIRSVAVARLLGAAALPSATRLSALVPPCARGRECLRSMGAARRAVRAEPRAQRQYAWPRVVRRLEYAVLFALACESAQRRTRRRVGSDSRAADPHRAAACGNGRLAVRPCRRECKLPWRAQSVSGLCERSAPTREV